VANQAEPRPACTASMNGISNSEVRAAPANFPGGVPSRPARGARQRGRREARNRVRWQKRTSSVAGVGRKGGEGFRESGWEECRAKPGYRITAARTGAGSSEGRPDNHRHRQQAPPGRTPPPCVQCCQAGPQVRCRRTMRARSRPQRRLPKNILVRSMAGPPARVSPHVRRAPKPRAPTEPRAPAEKTAVDSQ
jgi:hypothetical protein